jgi:cell division protein FtsB
MADIYDQLKAWEHEAEQLKKVNKKLRKKNAAIKAEVERLRGLYQELIMGVSSKSPCETRRQTALRYIKEREANAMIAKPAQAALKEG